ncbi:hypothetical protein B0H34DRAFT_663958 [Crassisporium funariophilum]|nr:hypothetical protein B0H34DRAFT_663958 [Crassisporium funariophilum]
MLCGYADSKHLMLEEQVAIFLYTCVTGLSICHVGEHFQHANSTISIYFQHILNTLSLPPFHTKYVRLPQEGDLVPNYIKDNKKLYPFF